MNNLFGESPTVGSCDTGSTENNGLVVRIQNLEQRVQYLEQQLSTEEHLRYENRAYDEKPQRKKIKWGKFKKFFVSVIKPVLNFIPNIINAIANFNKSVASRKSRGNMAFA